MNTKTRARRSPTVADAIAQAKAFGYAWMVCELDYEDTRRRYLRPLRYADEDEFFAFGGYIISIGHPDGTGDT